ncbi:hypothetical protein [Streptomyces sp. NPDC002265]|uniref:aromatic-ring hydroxylase C-terminal domain-containing protein n=1 Tax=Streptomyces sp. NPDC002265 TaxID=3154415 RepID=UPI003317B674
MAGIDIAYPAAVGTHPLTGKRAPDIPLTGERRHYEVLRGRRFALVTPAGARLSTSIADDWDSEVEFATSAGPTGRTGQTRGILWVQAAVRS